MPDYVRESDCYRRMNNLRNSMDEKLWRIQALQITTLITIIAAIISRLF